MQVFDSAEQAKLLEDLLHTAKCIHESLEVIHYRLGVVLEEIQDLDS